MFQKNEIVSCVVVETIFKKDPYFIKSVLEKLVQNTGSKSIFNERYLKKCPVGSIIVKVPNPSVYMVLYPFFSSHFSLPVKPGEHVWGFFPDGFGTNDIGYWMSRRATDEPIEDVNFTHNTRSIYKEYHNSIITKENEDYSKNVYYGVEGKGFDSYKSLLGNTLSNNAHVFESVERVKKKPGDLLFQGSNNAQLLLTSGYKKDTGTIIMTTGRGNSPDTEGKVINNIFDLEENNKASILSKIDKKNAREGNIDVLNDKASLIISENLEHMNIESVNTLEDYEFTDMSHVFARADIIRESARNEISMEAPEIIMGSGGEPYIKYSSFESLIGNIVKDINTLALQISEINGVLYQIGSLGPATVTGTPSSGLGPVLATAAGILNPPGSGESEKVYNATLSGRSSEISDCRSQKIFGE